MSVRLHPPMYHRNSHSPTTDTHLYESIAAYNQVEVASRLCGSASRVQGTNFPTLLSSTTPGIPERVTTDVFDHPFATALNPASHSANRASPIAGANLVQHASIHFS